MSKLEQFREQLQIFMGSDHHSVEIQKLAHILEQSFLGLSPYLTETDGERFAAFIDGARQSIARHLAGHLEQTVKEVNHAKSN